MLASILIQSGYKTGLYTSPHLKDFRERIRVNGQKIPEADVVSFVEENKNIIGELGPSFFEMTAAMAFEYFKKEKVDVAVIEVGMGGRLDSTNIITPDLSVITNIGLDHTQFLGSTKALIAKEKAGIIKQNIPVVIGETDPETIGVFKQTASGKNAQLIQADKMYRIPFSTFSHDNKQIMQVYSGNEIKFKDLKVSLLGWYQRKNTVTVLSAVDTLTQNGWKIERKHVYKGLEDVRQATGLSGRWQVIGHNPRTICDTGHNEDGVKEIVEQIKNTPYKNLHMIWGMVNDKDITAVLKLLPEDAVYYFTRASIPRSLDEKALKAKALELGLKGENYPDVKTALNEAKKNATPNDLIFIGGSTFIVADII
jgi:dihydrofolate synthase/folylpolyglutamate synthase